MWTVGRCIVCKNQAATLICPFISSFFFLSNFQTLKFFVTLSSRTVRPRRLKLGTYVGSGQWADVWCIPKSGCCLFVPLFLHFLSLQFSNIKIFCHTFIRNCESYKVETWYTCGQWVAVLCIPESGCCCIFVPLFCIFIFSNIHGWLGRAMVLVLDSFQCGGVLLLWHMVGQRPAVLSPGAGWVGCVLFYFFNLVCLIFLF